MFFVLSMHSNWIGMKIWTWTLKKTQKLVECWSVSPNPRTFWSYSKIFKGSAFLVSYLWQVISVCSCIHTSPFSWEENRVSLFLTSTQFPGTWTTRQSIWPSNSPCNLTQKLNEWNLFRVFKQDFLNLFFIVSPLGKKSRCRFQVGVLKLNYKTQH